MKYGILTSSVSLPGMLYERLSKNEGGFFRMKFNEKLYIDVQDVREKSLTDEKFVPPLRAVRYSG